MRMLFARLLLRTGLACMDLGAWRAGLWLTTRGRDVLAGRRG